MQVGPFAVIEGGTKIGDHTVIMSHASVLYGTTVGSNCRIFQGAAVGGIPQDLKYDGADTRLVIG
ncbi:MAG: acyl-[acyl-carrier-protein]--UDP-N-acetylglucosamine O-acyltransferase, partial [Candidatus Marinimicrobia bacterium]|nr:acyl-[acyl-carrier-protein]--UDP-N-acetylglucosamine O-acyltransferase [Candidatus Neomarinimicrobiota bacterium]